MRVCRPIKTLPAALCGGDGIASQLTVQFRARAIPASRAVRRNREQRWTSATCTLSFDCFQGEMTMTPSCGSFSRKLGERMLRWSSAERAPWSALGTETQRHRAAGRKHVDERAKRKTTKCTWLGWCWQTDETCRSLALSGESRRQKWEKNVDYSTVDGDHVRTRMTAKEEEDAAAPKRVHITHGEVQQFNLAVKCPG